MLGHIRFSETSFDDFVADVANVAVRAVPSADEISITLIGERGPYTAASSGKLAVRLDERQYEQDSGPCLQAAADRTTISVPDANSDARWGEWAPQAAKSGARSVLSVGLDVSEEVSGALNLYGRVPRAFGRDAIGRAQTFAGLAGVALANAHLYFSAVTLAAQLQEAMHSRAVIEQAKGIVMERRRCSSDEAFAYLTKTSQDRNHKVRDVCAAIVAGVTQRHN